MGYTKNYILDLQELIIKKWGYYTQLLIIEEGIRTPFFYNIVMLLPIFLSINPNLESIGIIGL